MMKRKLKGPKGQKDRHMGPLLEANVEKMEAQLKLWAERIDGLAAKTGKSGAKSQIEYQLRIDDLKIKRVMAQAKVDEFKAAGSEKWEEFRAGIERAWSDLETTLSELKP